MTGPGLDTSKRPFVLIWELTQACGLACEHCRAEARPERHPDELTTAEGERLLADCRRFGEGQLVVLSGGDPMAREDVVDLVTHGTDIGLRMTLTPSGTERLTAERIDALADAGLRRMALSLDGACAASHDSFRGEAGSFESTIAAAEHARDAGLPIQINTTVCAGTVDDLPAIRDRVADLGAVLWSVFFLVPVGRGAVLDPVTPERAERVMHWLADVADEAPFDVKTTEAPHYRRVCLERESADNGRPRGAPTTDGGATPPAPDDTASDDVAGPPGAIGRRTGIVAGDGFAFVSHVGELFPSGFLPKAAGTVPEEDLVDLYRNAPLFQALRDKDALEGKCGACPYRGVCGGSRSRAYATTGNPLASDPLCAYVPEGYDGALPARQQG